ncbi:MAG: hypothetical protein ACREJO_01440 [Phycisphaerales bacterium]
MAGLADSAACPECGMQALGLLRRECFNCEYDLTGLESSGVCPECGTAVALTLQHPLIRELDPAKARHASGGLWLMVGAYSALFVGGLLGAAFTSAGATIMLPVLALAWLGLYIAGTIRLVLGTPKVTRAKIVCLVGAGVSLGTFVMMILLPMCGVDPSEAMWGMMILVASGGMYAHLAALALIVRQIAYGLGRRRLAAVGTRWVYYTCIWHGLVWLSVIAIALCFVRTSTGSSSDIFGSGAPFIVAWFFSWFGHAVWVIVGMVMMIRLARAARAQVAAIGNAIR